MTMMNKDIPMISVMKPSCKSPKAAARRHILSNSDVSLNK